MSTSCACSIGVGIFEIGACTSEMKKISIFFSLWEPQKFDVDLNCGLTEFNVSGVVRIAMKSYVLVVSVVFIALPRQAQRSKKIEIL